MGLFHLATLSLHSHCPKPCSSLRFLSQYDMVSVLANPCANTSFTFGQCLYQWLISSSFQLDLGASSLPPSHTVRILVLHPATHAYAAALGRQLSDILVEMPGPSCNASFRANVPYSLGPTNVQLLSQMTMRPVAILIHCVMLHCIQSGSQGLAHPKLVSLCVSKRALPMH